MQSHPTTVRNGTLALRGGFPSALDDPPAPPCRFEERPHVGGKRRVSSAGDATDDVRPGVGAITQGEDGRRRRVESDPAGSSRENGSASRRPEESVRRCEPDFRPPC